MYGKLEEKPFVGSLKPNPPQFFLRLAPRALALGGLLALFPLFLLCAVLIRLSSPGAVFFRQRRVGVGGTAFTLYKFRTMSAAAGLPVTAENDLRITRFGRFLRKTKLDELPELYNILRGDMAFVGPRPEVVELVDFENPLWREVLSVRPGITDPVTLEFRNEENLLAGVEDKLKFYREVIQPYKLEGYADYLKKKCLKNDLKIVARTFMVVLFPRTAPPLKIKGMGAAEQRTFDFALSEQK